MGKRKPLRATAGTAIISKKLKNESNRKVEHGNEDDEWAQVERDNFDADDNSSDSQEENDDDDESDGGIQLLADENAKIVEDCTFDFKDMKEDYAMAIRTLLLQGIENPSHALILADLISTQAIVGTVITAEDSDDPFAFATILPLPECRKCLSLQHLLSALSGSLDVLFKLNENKKSMRPISSEIKQLRRILAETNDEESTTGVLIYHKYTNLPFQLIAPLHRNLWEDYSWAISAEASKSSNEDTEDDLRRKRFFSSMKNLLVVCQGSESSEADLNYDSAKGKEPKKQRKGSESSGAGATDITGSSSAVIFDLFEDEIFMQRASAAVLFPFSNAHDSSSSSSSSMNSTNRKGGKKTVLLLTVDGWKQSVEELAKLLPDKE